MYECACPVGDYLEVKFTIRRRWLRYENCLAGESGALTEDFRIARTRNFVEFRGSDASATAVSGSRVETGEGASVFRHTDAGSP